MLINICRYKKETPLQATYTGGQQKITINSLSIIYKIAKPPLSLVYRYIKVMLSTIKEWWVESSYQTVCHSEERRIYSRALHITYRFFTTFRM